MYICICNAITDNQIIEAQQEGHTTIKSISRHLGLGIGCGRCVVNAKELLEKNSASKYIPQQIPIEILAVI